MRGAACAAILSIVVTSSGSAAGPPQPSQARVEAALQNIAALERPGQDGLATFADGNKYVQCRRLPDHALHCEAAGALLQPSLSHVLVPERVAKLAALGWSLDSSFGNFAQVFATDLPASQVAEKILKTLTDGYDADVTNLEVRSDWITSQACPPRNGPTQNLAGAISDPPALAKGAIYACSYTPAPSASIGSAADLINVYGTRVTGEPGRVPNYWKNYPLETVDDATIARELLTVLYDVYGYIGAPKLKIGTEKER